MIHKDKSTILWIKNPDFGVFGVMNRTTAIKINVNYEEESNNHNNNKNNENNNNNNVLNNRNAI